MIMDEVNMILKQSHQMELMNRVMRYRRENGLALPIDAEGLKMAMQQDGMQILRNAKKREMKRLLLSCSSRIECFAKFIWQEILMMA